MWVGLSPKGTLTTMKAGGAYERNSLDRIVYLHFRPDQSSSKTVIAIKITFETTGNHLDKNWIRAKNNLKARPVSTGFGAYQSFHEGKNEEFHLKNNFHLPAGWLNRKIPFTTSDPAERRRQLLYADQDRAKEQTYRAYLLTLDQVARAGTCVDFKPFFPKNVTSFSVETVDLLKESDSDNYYRDSISAELK